MRLQIQRAGLILDILANVSSRHVGSGMGLVFGEITEAQRAILQGWLAELGFPSQGLLANPFPTANSASVPGSTCATRVVQVLLRKGLLSQSEALEILNGCEIDRL